MGAAASAAQAPPWSPAPGAERSELRRRKEAFVTGLRGTTKWEVFCVMGCVPMFWLFSEPRARGARFWGGHVAEGRRNRAGRSTLCCGRAGWLHGGTH
jgi:hypothetical protein